MAGREPGTSKYSMIGDCYWKEDSREERAGPASK